MTEDIISKAAKELQEGNMVAVYDGDEREGEADLIIHAKHMTPKTIETLRKNAGGLICVAIEPKIAERMGLVFYTDILASSEFELKKMECKKTAYKDKPSFSIPVNHTGVYTGITDNDRSLTIKKLAELAEKKGDLRQEFMKEFYSPGHVFLLVGRGIQNRKGHTELALELAKRADMAGMMVLCEMLGKGNALSKEKVKEYTKDKGIVFLEGRDFE